MFQTLYYNYNFFRSFHLQPGGLRIRIHQSIESKLNPYANSCQMVILRITIPQHFLQNRYCKYDHLETMYIKIARQYQEFIWAYQAMEYT